MRWAWLVLGVAGCSTAGWVVGGTAAFIGVARAPAHEVEQVYYLGVFDPLEQVPPTVYRVTVRGQSSAISLMRFSSGWVPAELIDSLNTSVAHDPANGTVQVKNEEGARLATLQTGRRLMLFGPEGFREAPRDHRLVIVMGSSPDKFFSAIDESLGVVARARDDQRNAELQKLLFTALSEVKAERERLADLAVDIKTDLGVPAEGA